MPAPLSLLAEKRRARFLGNPVPAGRSRARGKRPPRHNGVAMISSARGPPGRRARDETTHEREGEGSARWRGAVAAGSGYHHNLYATMRSTIHPVRSRLSHPPTQSQTLFTKNLHYQYIGPQDHHYHHYAGTPDGWRELGLERKGLKVRRAFVS